ncbi:MAG TPA: HD domain-containing protein [Spirochaetota bacterium]|nr:HD domain-containing protein [Spirochaetota bacterium]HPF05875.1 HD domain-containing protein [Spirochaetota bacterium]HPJ40714.1 HD domain-containing protein [Spirochaetota bacterium]HPR35983.1 HD domain-containing protein [Spirochaetota bacterium]HRX45897.1 HD domain-containing protein [Spirochaetota bacterium]
MSEKKIKYIELNLADLKENINRIQNNNIPVWRKNKSGSLVIIPLERLEQFIGNNESISIIFYIDEKWESNIKISSSLPDIKPAAAAQHPWTDNSGISDTYTERRKKYLEMHPEKREQEFEQLIDSLISRPIAGNFIDTNALLHLINAVSDAFVINKAAFDDFYNEAKSISPDHIKNIAKNTTILVQSVMGIIRNNTAANNFINLLGEKSTGSTVDHMNCVFLIFLPFCYYYNSYFAKGKISKIRAEFKSRYYKYYKKLFPLSPPESLEDVFKGGMREIDQDKLLQYGIGAFLHDIGKLDNIDYFEGEEKYDRKIIMRHAPISYNMIVKTREFDHDVAYLAALHHEYYNDHSGYGISKLLFPDNIKKYKEPVYCLSYELEDIKSGLALAYVPAKILEIVDVFDALTDSKRKYRDSEFSVDEALEIMLSSFIDKNTKLDPILFSIFVDFINSHSILKDKSILSKVLTK